MSDNIYKQNIFRATLPVLITFEDIKKAYNEDNFNPILIYTEKLKILTYSGYHTISINKILLPVKDKHNFILNE